MRRVAQSEKPNTPRSVLSPSRRAVSLVFLVLIPYIDRKLARMQRRLEADDADGIALTRVQSLLLQAYPVVQSVIQACNFALTILYAFDRTSISSVSLLLSGQSIVLWLHRLTAASQD